MGQGASAAFATPALAVHASAPGITGVRPGLMGGPLDLGVGLEAQVLIIADYTLAAARRRRSTAGYR